MCQRQVGANGGSAVADEAGLGSPRSPPNEESGYPVSYYSDLIGSQKWQKGTTWGPRGKVVSAPTLPRAHHQGCLSTEPLLDPRLMISHGKFGELMRFRVSTHTLAQAGMAGSVPSDFGFRVQGLGKLCS